jgi:hypothetical protein
MNQRQLQELTQQWTPEQLLAAYDFCCLMSDTLWQQHEDTLLELMVERDRISDNNNRSGCQQSDNLELPFDDPIPF